MKTTLFALIATQSALCYIVNGPLLNLGLSFTSAPARGPDRWDRTSRLFAGETPEPAKPAEQAQPAPGAPGKPGAKENKKEVTLFKLMELPYVGPLHFQKMDALSPDISEETVKFHYTKHHQGYVNQLNGRRRHTLRTREDTPAHIRMHARGWENRGSKIYNMASQVWNHDFYWKSMDPESGRKPLERTKTLIEEEFGSFEEFRMQFEKTAASHFGSGWVWLLYYNFRPHLRIVDTHDSDNPVKLYNAQPLLVMGKRPQYATDVWEHAYYIDYRNDRKAYINGWFKKINWNRVERLIRGEEI